MSTDLNKFVGMNVVEAVKELKVNNKEVREVSPGEMTDMQFVENRVNVEANGGVVTKVWRG